MTLFDLSGKTAAVIGGNGVLGSEISKGLAAHGAAVAVAGRNADKARAVEEQIIERGGRSRAFKADATKKQELEQLLRDILSWNSSVDILVNCAGKNSNTPFLELEMNEWDEIMNINLKSIVQACQIFSKQMIAQGKGGSIINISSVSSDPPLSKVLTYSASKAGVNSVTKYLARELAPHHVRVNAIIPGFFPAEQNKKILSPERIDAIIRHTPASRFGKPHELQGAAVFLASEEASGFVTGTFIRVDGGFGAVSI